LFRLGFAAGLIATACYIAVTALFYNLFKPVSRSLSLLSAFFSLVGCAIQAFGSLFQLAPLVVLRGGQYMSVFTVEQLQALALMFLKLNAQALNIGLVFFGLGSTVFAYLWFKSRYIPRGLAAWGIFSSLVVAIVTLAIMVFRSLADVVIPVYFAPIFIFEVTLGIWLVVKGIQAPIVESGRVA
jgi:hypothetical protein